MPQGIPLHLPFPAEINADVVGAEVRNLRWAREHRLVRSAEAERRYRSWALPELAARTNPRADQEGLDVVFGVLSFMFLFDDQFDGPLGVDCVKAADLCTLLATMTQPDPAPTPPTRVPVIDAWANLWRRCAQGMSTDWQKRAGGNFRDYFRAHIHEVAARADGTPLPLHTYLRLRQNTVAMRPLQDLIERANGFELPPRVHEADQLAEMREITASVIAMNNDITSVEKEELRKDPHNLVLVVEREYDVSRDQAITRIRSMAREHVERFIELEREIHVAGLGLCLQEVELSCLHRFVTGMRHWMRGCHDWESGSARYGAAQLPATRPGHLEDLVTPH